MRKVYSAPRYLVALPPLEPPHLKVAPWLLSKEGWCEPQGTKTFAMVWFVSLFNLI